MPIAVAVLAVIALAAPTALGIQIPRDAAGPAPLATNLSSALAADGTFLGNQGVQGTVDTSAWRLVSDLAAGEAPRFAPVDRVTVTGSATEWYALGGQADGAVPPGQYVFAVAVWGTDVYIGGAFTDVNGISTAAHIARWDGENWHGVGTGAGGGGSAALNNNVLALSVWGTKLIVGGQFTDAGGHDAADFVATWDTANWAPLDTNVGGGGVGVLNGSVQAIAISNTDIYLGGSFTNVDANANADYVARWDGSAWSALGSNSDATDGALNAYVLALAVEGGVVYAGGTFTNAGGNSAADYVARFTGSSWSGLGASDPAEGPVQSYVAALMFFEGDLYAGGNFTDVAGNLGADYIARWGSDNAWASVGNAALNQPVSAFTIWGTELIVGGQFTDAGGELTADRVARWNGIAWLALGSHASGGGALTGPVHAVAASAADVYTGGSFSNAAGIDQADYIARWTPPPPPTNYQPDGRIKKGSGAFVGNNIYNSDGTNQTKIGSAARGKNITFTISIQNDGDATDRFTMAASGSATTKYTVRYFRGTTEITTAVGAGTYVTPVIGVGGKLAITVKVKVKSTATAGSSVTRLVTLTSFEDSGQVDTVKFVGKRT